MAGVNVGKGTGQPQNGFVDGVVSFTTEATTYSINVSTLTDGTSTSFPNVTSVIHAQVSVNSGAALTTAPSLAIASWTTTNAVVKISAPAGLSTASMSLRFVGK